LIKEDAKLCTNGQEELGPMTKTFYVVSFLFVFFISGCAQTSVVPEAQAPLNEPSAPIQSLNPSFGNEACAETHRIVGSSQNFVRFRHSPSELPVVEAKAFEWCQQYEKSPFLQKQRCGVCCSTSYFCR
jgi:hypothetical protein